MNNTSLKRGDRVRHDYSLEKGTIKAAVKGNQLYRYFVYWGYG